MTFNNLQAEIERQVEVCLNSIVYSSPRTLYLGRGAYSVLDGYAASMAMIPHSNGVKMLAYYSSAGRLEVRHINSTDPYLVMVGDFENRLAVFLNKLDRRISPC
jgi:hypothetical protein